MRGGVEDRRKRGVKVRKREGETERRRRGVEEEGEERRRGGAERGRGEEHRCTLIENYYPYLPKTKSLSSVQIQSLRF